jgi:basic amino acid/polyamine antiporter, APA family
MIYSLIICTILYCLIALVVTGMVRSETLEGKTDPLAYIFSTVGQDWIFYVVSVSAIIAMASVLLVFQLGQPRIWMSMSRDGLLPKAFSRIHPKYHTPSFATIVTGIIVSIPCLFLDMSFVLDMTSVGTLFAFVLVCGGVIILENRPRTIEPKFKIPYVDSKYVLLLGWALFLVWGISEGTLLSALMPGELNGWVHAIPFYIFLITTVILTVMSFSYKISLIPVAGLLSCLYLMSEIPVASWWRFFIWLVIGVVIYFTYSRFHSKLRAEVTNG